MWKTNALALETNCSQHRLICHPGCAHTSDIASFDGSSNTKRNFELSRTSTGPPKVAVRHSIYLPRFHSMWPNRATICTHTPNVQSSCEDLAQEGPRYVNMPPPPTPQSAALHHTHMGFKIDKNQEQNTITIDNRVCSCHQ